MVKTTLDGEEVFTLGYPKESEFYKLDKDGKPATKYSPTNLAIAPNGDIYVGDGYGSSYINQYNSKGEFIRTFGGKGKEPGQLDCPHGITVDLRGPQPQCCWWRTAPTPGCNTSRWMASTSASWAA
jgi:hypothetical protein